MKLEQYSFDELYFPETEWQLLREPFRYVEEHPHFFVWAAQISGEKKPWAWHPSGAAVASSQNGKIPTLILPVETELDAHGLYLRTAFEHSKASDAEWVSALQVLQNRFKYRADVSGLPRHWIGALNACGLEGHLGVLAQRQKYFYLTFSEKKFLHQKNWDLATFELLESLSEKIREGFIEALEKWNISQSQAREASNYLMILTKKFGEPAALKVLSSVNHKSQEDFRVSLLRTAQPELAQLSQTRIDKLRALQVPPRTSVFGDPTFEKEGIKITHNPRSMNDVEDFKTWIEKPEILEKLRGLLEIYQ